MGLLFASGSGSKKQVNRPSSDLLFQMGCRACPLNKAKHLVSPKMPPSGSDKPLIYVLGEGPGKEEDKQNLQFVGHSGDLLWSYIPQELKSKIRLNNVVNCRTSETNRDPEKVEMECCRPRIVSDIERTKPVAIFGLGGFPLQWADKPSGIELWRGRRFPIKVGDHVCWYYAIRHPAYILHLKNQRGFWQESQDEEQAFKFDIQRAITEVTNGLPSPILHNADTARKNITCITGRKSGDVDYVLDFLDYASTKDAAGVDFETQNLRPYLKSSVILTKAVSVNDETLAFAWEHKEAGWSSSQLELLRDAWLRFLKSQSKKIVHNLAFEMEWTVFLNGREYARAVPWEDTQTQAFVLDERVGDIKPGALALDFLTMQYFGFSLKNLTKGLNKGRMSAEPLSSILPYNGLDAKYHRLVYLAQNKRIKEEGLEFQYAEKLRQVPTCVLTQIKGVPIDTEVNKELAEEYNAKIKMLLDKIRALPEAKKFRQLTGKNFNPGSPQDVIVILKNVLNTREGQSGKGWSTDKYVLNKIDNPIAKEILNYREVVKLKGTYVDPMSVGSDTLYDGNVLHQHLGTTFTETGRLESEDPNCQNWPVRTKVGKRVRRQVAL